MRVENYLDDILGSRARLAVLRVLFSQPWLEMTARQVASLAKRSAHEPVRRAVKQLAEVGVIHLKYHGGAHVISLDKGNAAYKPLKALFEEERKSRIQFHKELKKLVPKEALNCINFGSIARGEERLSSDVDLLLIVPDAKTKRKLDGKLPVFIEQYGMVLSWMLMTSQEFRRERKGSFLENVRLKYVIIFGNDPWESEPSK